MRGKATAARLSSAANDAPPRSPRAPARLCSHRSADRRSAAHGRPTRHRHAGAPVHDLGLPARRLPALEQLLVRRPLRLRRLQRALLPAGRRRGRVDRGGGLGGGARLLVRGRGPARVGPRRGRALPRAGGDRHRHLLRLGRVPVPGRSGGGGGRPRRAPSAGSGSRSAWRRSSRSGSRRSRSGSWRWCSQASSSASETRSRIVRRNKVAVAALAATAAACVVLQRAFPSGDWYPYHLSDLLVVAAFSAAGLYLTAVEPARARPADGVRRLPAPEPGHVRRARPRRLELDPALHDRGRAAAVARGERQPPAVVARRWRRCSRSRSRCSSARRCGPPTRRGPTRPRRPRSGGRRSAS